MGSSTITVELVLVNASSSSDAKTCKGVTMRARAVKTARKYGGVIGLFFTPFHTFGECLWITQKAAINRDA